MKDWEDVSRSLTSLELNAETRNLTCTKWFRTIRLKCFSSMTTSIIIHSFPKISFVVAVLDIDEVRKKN